MVGLTVDARGLRCPHPVVEARRVLRELDLGARIRLLADDPMASVDVAAFCARAGHRLLSVEEDAGSLAFVIEKGLRAEG